MTQKRLDTYRIIWHCLSDFIISVLIFDIFWLDGSRMYAVVVKNLSNVTIDDHEICIVFDEDVC